MLVKTDIQGSNIYGIVSGAKEMGLNAEAYEGNYRELFDGVINKEFELPLIAHIINEDNFEHFVVIVKITKSKLKIFDPGCGIKYMSMEEFTELWTGHIIAFEKTEKFIHSYTIKGVYTKYVNLLFPQKKALFLILITSIVSVMISLIGAFAYEFVIDNFILSGDVNKNSSYENMKILMSALIGLYFLQSIIQMIRSIMLAITSKEINIKLMHFYIDKIHKLPLSFHQSMRVGELLSRFTDIQEIREAVSGAAIIVIFDTLLFLGGALLMFAISRLLFIMVIFVSILYAIIFVIFRPSISKINNSIMSANAKTVSDLKESLEGVETIKLNQTEEFFSSKIKTGAETLADKIFRGEIVFAIQEIAAGLIESISSICILWIGAQLVRDNILTLGLLITFSTLIGFAIIPIREIIEMQPIVQRAFVAAGRLNDVLESKNEETNRGNYSTYGCDIKIDNVTFRYGNRFPVLSNLNMYIKTGEKVAVIGNSGSGKTTLAKLLMKLQYPEKGKIVFDGEDIMNLSTNHIRKKIAYIQQDTYLFSDTIKNNLVYENDAIPDEEIIKVCKICQINEYIKGLPDGFNYRIDEGGKNLSGGQKQRLSIARALLRKPQILIMDEATSHLDKESEENINKILFTECKNMTCILITHNPSIMKKCDKVFMIRNGRVTECKI